LSSRRVVEIACTSVAPIVAMVPGDQVEYAGFGGPKTLRESARQ
jgi:hypothetical protein